MLSWFQLSFWSSLLAVRTGRTREHWFVGAPSRLNGAAWLFALVTWLPRAPELVPAIGCPAWASWRRPMWQHALARATARSPQLGF
jgi:hypothetical protein